jgi:hypothetical protein
MSRERVARLAVMVCLVACGRDAKREAEIRSKSTGQWVHLDPDRPGQREELDLAEDGTCVSRLFPAGASQPVTQKGHWRVQGDDLILDGCSADGGGPHRPRFEAGKMIFIGNEGSFPYERRHTGAS